MTAKLALCGLLANHRWRFRKSRWATSVAGPARSLATTTVWRDLVPGGIRLSPAPSAAAAPVELLDLKRECCAWIHFEGSNGSTVTLTAEGDGEATLVGLCAETH
jgi:hypothetical protein